MAKEQIHNYLRTAIILAGVVFAGGGYAMQISSNGKGVEKNSIKIETVNERVHIVEKNQEREIALKESLLGTLTRLETKMDTFSVEQNQIKLDVNTTKVQVNTLTRD